MEKLLFEKEKMLYERAVEPTVSIILPFEPRLNLKSDLQHRLKITLQKTERELLKIYASDKVENLILKLQRIVRDLNFDTHKKSIAIFVSPLIEKIFYLDVSVEEKIAINTSFEIRDLICNEETDQEYLILLLSSKFSKMYLADRWNIQLIKSGVANNIYAYQRDMPERLPHFDDLHEHNQIETAKFLHHVDIGLSQILKAYPFPVFVLGVEKLLGHFKKITKSENNIAGYIHGNYEEATEHELKEILQPHIAKLDKLKQANLIKQIERAMDEHKLSIGVESILDSVSNKNCRLLIVEKDFVYPNEKEENRLPGVHINDAVVNIVEKVIESGAAVEVVDNDFLKEYQHIVLIKYY